MARTRKQKKQWKDLTPMQRVATIVTGCVQLSLLATALVDIRRRPASEINGSKPLWTAVSFVNFAGPIAYFVFGRKRAMTHTPT
jgi:hypothetical protein